MNETRAQRLWKAMEREGGIWDDLRASRWLIEVDGHGCTKERAHMVLAHAAEENPERMQKVEGRKHAYKVLPQSGSVTIQVPPALLEETRKHSGATTDQEALEAALMHYVVTMRLRETE